MPVFLLKQQWKRSDLRSYLLNLIILKEIKQIYFAFWYWKHYQDIAYKFPIWVTSFLLSILLILQHSPPLILSGIMCSHDSQKLSSNPRRWNVKREAGLTLNVDQACVKWEIRALHLGGAYHEYLQKGKKGGKKWGEVGEKVGGRKEGMERWRKQERRKKGVLWGMNHNKHWWSAKGFLGRGPFIQSHPAGVPLGYFLAGKGAGIMFGELPTRELTILGMRVGQTSFFYSYQVWSWTFSDLSERPNSSASKGLEWEKGWCQGERRELCSILCSILREASTQYVYGMGK